MGDAFVPDVDVIFEAGDQVVPGGAELVHRAAATVAGAAVSSAPAIYAAKEALQDKVYEAYETATDAIRSWLPWGSEEEVLDPVGPQVATKAAMATRTVSQTVTKRMKLQRYPWSEDDKGIKWRPYRYRRYRRWRRWY